MSVRLRLTCAATGMEPPLLQGTATVEGDPTVAPGGAGLASAVAAP
jgi:hypothetical protein